MTVGTPEQVVEMLDQVFNESDIDAVLNFYEEGTVVVTEPGKSIRGRGELSQFFEQVFASKPSARQLKTYVLEAEGIALFLPRWTLSGIGPNDSCAPRCLVATTVFRKQSMENGKC